MRTLNNEHKQKIREAKLKYYSDLREAGIKRPYQRSKNKTYTVQEIRSNAIKIIEKFNDVLRKYGTINEEIINNEFNKETKFENKFFEFE